MNLVIMVGIPRSGKSTYVDKNYSDYNIVCADDIRLAFGTQFDRRLEKITWAVHDAQLAALIIRGRNIVIDNTNVNIGLIKQYARDAGKKYNVKIRIMHTSKSECLKRNDGIGAVPVDVIDRMHEQLLNLMRQMEDLKRIGEVKLIDQWV